MYYLATPYANHPKGIARAFRNAAKAGAILTDNGVDFFSPIVHFHPIAMEGNLPARDSLYWYTRCKPFEERCDSGIIVLMDDGWEDSTGVTGEIHNYEDRGLPVIYMKPGILPEEFK